MPSESLKNLKLERRVFAPAPRLFGNSTDPRSHHKGAYHTSMPTNPAIRVGFELATDGIQFYHVFNAAKFANQLLAIAKNSRDTVGRQVEPSALLGPSSRTETKPRCDFQVVLDAANLK